MVAERLVILVERLNDRNVVRVILLLKSFLDLVCEAVGID